MHRIDIRRAGAIQVASGQTILEAALAAAILYPHGCKRGRCGACKSRLIVGKVELLPHTPFALTAEEMSNGLILACRAQPRSDCEVAWLNDNPADEPPVELMSEHGSAR